MTKAQIEKKYGVTIADDSYYNPRTGRTVKAYRFYTADGCQWENGLHTLKAVQEECEEWAGQILEIKAMADRIKHGARCLYRDPAIAARMR